MSLRPVSYSTRTGNTFATPETMPLALYTRLFGAGFQDPNSDDWQPDPSIMLRQSVLSAVKEQRQALLAGASNADQIKLDQYFTSLRDMENQLAIQLQKPDKCASCVLPAAPKELPRSAAVETVCANTKTMAKLLAIGLACNQMRVFNFVHTSGTSETYIARQSKIYHQITHDEPTDATLGYQPETSKLLIMAFSNTGYAKLIPSKTFRYFWPDVRAANTKPASTFTRRANRSRASR